MGKIFRFEMKFSAIYLLVIQISAFRSPKQSAIEINPNPKLIVQEPLGGWKPVPRPRPGSRPGPNYKWTCYPCKCVTGGMSCEWQKVSKHSKKHRPEKTITS